MLLQCYCLADGVDTMACQCLVCVLMYQVSLYVELLVYVITIAGFQSNIILFNINVLIGAPADKLSTVIYWHNFGHGLNFISAFFL